MQELTIWPSEDKTEVCLLCITLSFNHWPWTSHCHWLCRRWMKFPSWGASFVNKAHLYLYTSNFTTQLKTCPLFSWRLGAFIPAFHFQAYDTVKYLYNSYPLPSSCSLSFYYIILCLHIVPSPFPSPCMCALEATDVSTAKQKSAGDYAKPLKAKRWIFVSHKIKLQSVPSLRKSFSVASGDVTARCPSDARHYKHMIIICKCPLWCCGNEGWAEEQGDRTVKWGRRVHASVYNVILLK